MTEKTDGRTANRQRTRKAILAAAQALVTQHHRQDFTFDDVAAQAGVSRRTVFNHFASKDELTLALCQDVLADVVEDFRQYLERTPVEIGNREAFFTMMLNAPSNRMLPKAVKTIASMVPVHDPDSIDSGLTTEAFQDFDELIRAQISRRLPGTTAFEAELFSICLIHLLALASVTWLTEFESNYSQASEDRWHELFAVGFHQLKCGLLQQT